MNTKHHLWFLILVLFVGGFSLFTYKSVVMSWPVTPEKSTRVWTIESKIRFKPDSGRPIKVNFYVPPIQSRFIKLDEHFVSKNYGVTTNREDSNLLSTWSIRRASGMQTLYYRVVVIPEERQKQQHKAPIFPTGLDLEGPEKAAAEAILNKVRAQSADSVTFAVEVMKQLLLPNNDNADLLLKRDTSPENLVYTAQKVLDGAHIPTKSVHGISLNTNTSLHRDVKPSALLAVWESGQKEWLYVQPKTAEVGMPKDFLTWWYGEHPLLKVEGGKNSSLSFSTSSNLQSALGIAQQEALQQDSAVLKFSLFSLPIQTQQVYAVMIMIPLGAFIILILRNLIGIETFGTFMPVLVALAFRETHLIYGILLFSTVVAIGLLIRFYLEHLKLLLVPRIAIVLSTVVLIMLMLSVVSYHLGFEYGLSIALFPMVIMTMTIERMSLLWEERNPWEAIKQGIGSLFAASVAYLAMNNPTADHLFFTFPELILVLMSAMLLLGMYRGYRVLELIRFKSLFKNLS